MKTGQFSQLFSILLLFLIILGATVFVLPMRDEIAVLETTRDAASTELQTLQAQYQSLSDLSEEVATSETTKQSLMAAVPSGYAQDQLLLDLSAMATDLSFKLNALNFSDTTSEEFGPTVTLTANFSGSYDQLIALLQKMETSDRLMRVVSLNVQRTSSTDIAFNMSIEAYYQ